MSETTEYPPAAIEEAPPAAIETAEAPQTEETAAARETATEPEPPPKKKGADARFAAMTARLRDSNAAREAAERRAAAAEAIANASRPDTTPAPIDPEAEIQRRLAERELAAKRTTLIETGRTAYGADTWTEKTQVLADMGALENAGFMEALLDESPQIAAKLVDHLAENADELDRILKKPGALVAKEMGRMAAKIAEPPPAPVVSRAPRPPAPVAPANVVKEPDIFDPKISMAEFDALMRKRERARFEERRARGR